MTTEGKMMEKEWLEWKDLVREHGINEMPDELLSKCFLLQMDEQMIYLSPQAAGYLMRGDEVKQTLTMDEFAGYLSIRSREIVMSRLARLTEGKSLRMDNQLVFVLGGEEVTGMITMVRVKGQPYIVGMLNVNYEVTDEYQKLLDDVTSQRNQAQSINQLILEGSTDYIYHLDLVNDICNFSPKATEVLPIDNPTFGNAMDSILSFIVPEDRNLFLKSFTPFLTGKSLYHRAEYRINTKQGEIMWIDCHGKGVHDAEGHPLMIAGSLMDVTEKKKIEDRMRQMLYFDILTGLKSRHCYEEEINTYLSDPEVKGSIVAINIRNFKLFNEIFGHSFGDKVLIEFASILENYVPESWGIYRLEADEFLIHLKENENESIMGRLTPLQMALAKARVLEGHRIYIDVTMGIAMYPEHGQTAEQLLKNADSVLYTLTLQNPEKVMFFNSKGGKDISKRYIIEHALRKDIENNYEHFRVVFQPIVKIQEKGKYWYGAETLLRYFNPDIPEITQEELIEILEVTDLIIPVGRWILAEALRECGHWKKAGVNVHVHVNFSVQQLSDAGLLAFVCEQFKRNQLEPEHLICELTETSLLNNLESASTLCWELRKMGAGIALDDFGTGYSSLNYLRIFPITQIKVDKSYVQGILDDEYNKIIISCLLDLSKSMNLELCVEGVETETILNLLTGMGIDIFQGYYFEKPLEADIIRKEFLQHLPVE